MLLEVWKVRSWICKLEPSSRKMAVAKYSNPVFLTGGTTLLRATKAERCLGGRNLIRQRTLRSKVEIVADS